LEPVTDGM
jgi:hypothetical protein